MSFGGYPLLTEGFVSLILGGGSLLPILGIRIEELKLEEAPAALGAAALLFPPFLPFENFFWFGRWARISDILFTLLCIAKYVSLVFVWWVYHYYKKKSRVFFCLYRVIFSPMGFAERSSKFGD